MRTLVQLSVEKKWQKKLAEAVAHARQGAHRALLFVSACRVPERTFLAVQAEHLEQSGVAVERLDAQGIATLALDPARGFLPEVFRLLAIPVPVAAAVPFRKEDLRQRVAYACALFHADAEDLRRGVLEQAVVSALAAEQRPVDREELVRRVALALGLAEPKHTLIRGALDRLRQRGVALGTNGTASLAEQARAEAGLAQGLREKQWGAFEQELTRALAGHVSPGAVEDARDAISADLGALLLATAAQTAAEIGAGGRSDRLAELRARVRALRQTLGALGVTAVDALLEQIAGVAEASGVGRQLLAGEVFVQLVSIERSRFVGALGASRDLQIVLDASVAIPLLCARVFGPGDQRYFVAAEHLAAQSDAHALPVALPRPYLEEAAAHLWQAWAEYGDIVDLDPDLRRSQNAFVAHYASLRGASTPDFDTYLGDHGFDPSLRSSDFRAVRAAMMGRLERRFSEYGVRVTDVPSAPDHRRRAEEAVSYALRERGGDARADILVEHDAAVVAWLMQGEADASVTRVLTTWDSILALLAERERPAWEVLDPIVLGDLLALIHADGDGRPRGVSAAILAVSDPDAERGARIWDLLVSIERTNLRDAELRRKAAAFKQGYLRRTAGDPRRAELQLAWEAYKAS